MTILIYGSPDCDIEDPIKRACEVIGIEAMVANLGTEGFEDSIALIKKKLDEKTKIYLVIDVKMPITENLMNALIHSINDSNFAGKNLSGLSGVSVIIPKSECESIPESIKESLSVIDAKILLNINTGDDLDLSSIGIPVNRIGMMVVREMGELKNYVHTLIDNHQSKPVRIHSLDSPAPTIH